MDKKQKNRLEMYFVMFMAMTILSVLSLVVLEDSIGGRYWESFVLDMSLTLQGNISIVLMGIGSIGMWYMADLLDWLKEDALKAPSENEVHFRQKKLSLQTGIAGSAYLFTYGVTLMFSIVVYHNGNIFKIATSGAGLTGVFICLLTGIAIWQLRLRLEWMAEEQEQAEAGQSDSNSLSN
ncbi:hypothetical protein [Shewanella xiamenensis]|uniref:hypothetical protein n=1 Tax=Shewanella xiamenensis TaxID=332186 RepID=UPI001185B9E0|nr:hypothetical protein [Shewanella xiamenensis]TVL32939.1 hypothetical protein AYI95_08445 [Shewanella xiamenensis]